MLESSMSALPYIASRCYLYHAHQIPVMRVPAQVRMMRSWGAEEKDLTKRKFIGGKRYGSMNLEIQQSIEFSLNEEVLIMKS